jgi:hypothetical protein
MKKYIVSTVLFFAVLVSPMLVQAQTTNLSSSQINSIIQFLQSFGVGQSVINNVEIALGGTSAGGSCGPTARCSTIHEYCMANSITYDASCNITGEIYTYDASCTAGANDGTCTAPSSVSPSSTTGTSATAPTISYITPTSAAVGSTVYVSGSGFNNEYSEVCFDNTNIPTAINCSGITSLMNFIATDQSGNHSFNIPSGLSIGSHTVQVCALSGGPANGSLPEPLDCSNNLTLNVVVSTTGTSATAPTITTTSLPSGTVGSSYSASISGSSGSSVYAQNSGYAWSVSGLPPGLVNGLPSGETGACEYGCSSTSISGTPTTAGTYPVTVTLTSGSQTVSKQFNLVIAASGSAQAPTSSSTSVPTLNVMINMSSTPPEVSAPANLIVGWWTTNQNQLSGCFGTGYNWNETLPNSGSGNRTISNVPAGTYTYSVTCNNALGGTITGIATITVAATASAITGTATPATTVACGSGKTFSGNSCLPALPAPVSCCLGGVSQEGYLCTYTGFYDNSCLDKAGGGVPACMAPYGYNYDIADINNGCNSEGTLGTTTYYRTITCGGFGSCCLMSTVPANSSCAASTCAGKICSDSCGNQYYGTKSCTQ